MFVELTGKMEINISHELSRRVSMKRINKFKTCDDDIFNNSKIDLRNIAEVH